METIIKGDQLEKIKHFLQKGYYDSAVKESCAILEEILKRIYKQALSELPIEDRTALMDGEAKIGKGTKSYTRFGFGELVGLYNRTRLLERWGKYILLVYDCLLNWLSFIGYKDMSKSVESAFQPGGGAQAEEKKAESAYQHMKKEIHSGYDPSIKLERRRLKRQAAYSEKHDAGSFAYAVERIGRREGLIGLDVGCADGYVTEIRFKPEFGFEKVIGLDRNETLIEKVRAEDHGMFRYHHIDLESRDFEEEMEDLMEEEGIDAFDVIFSALTLHHLKNPVRLLMKLRKYLRKGGAVILRGVDDGGMMAYDDGGLVEEILADWPQILPVAARHWLFGCEDPLPVRRYHRDGFRGAHRLFPLLFRFSPKLYAQGCGARAGQPPLSGRPRAHAGQSGKDGRAVFKARFLFFGADGVCRRHQIARLSFAGAQGIAAAGRRTGGRFFAGFRALPLAEFGRIWKDF